MKLMVLSVVLTWSFVNILKAVISCMKAKKISIKIAFGNGGMPSGHTSLVVAMAAALFFDGGFSPLFFVIVVLSFLVIYDAVFVRNVIEKQSQVINELAKGKGSIPKLEENVGHTLSEVMVSAAISIFIPFLLYRVF